ncbi:hypothetical protein M438DRAFT_407571 [Aureobasidium pullulans EXF-150]|uniref:Mannosyltransferase n=1 Tax=Aureobasidium pullulans EXF-150 TaxID=1043002 RepID=A0A074XDV9_AURPU|nr:uncharacterized protein M438DRAFT_407571 [Aureobasidium pullulans EXF-150]KEQ81919.1 hypothetical protein M438DRAFT_407571 [Aureobasidium pullulans EXF-150]
MPSPPPPSRPARRQFMTTMTASKAAKLQNNKALPVTPTAPAEARPVHMFPADLTKPLDAIADPIYLNPLITFYILAAAHALAALYFPIQDCDEVYNYYEPTHYLTDGYGKQTWEYSPDYAIRSWAYVTLHAFVIGLRRVIPIWGLPKVWKFYFLRIMLGAVCAASEARLYTKISRTLNPRLGMLFFLIMLTSPGMFHASVSFLPSTFSMYTTALGMAAFMDWRGGMRTAQGMMCMIGGAFLGWPFAAALIAPFMLEEFVLAYFTDKEEFISFCYRILDGSVRSTIVLVLQFCLDAFFYRKVAIVPFNIVWYNVIAAREGKGPDIYGTEPWHFYIRNLLLNFNIWFVIAVAAMPLYFVHTFVLRQPIFKQSYLRGVFFLTPFYLWLAIFTLQPHKEERFMYPIYPALGFNAAMGSHILLSWLGTSNPRSLIAMIPAKLRLLFASLCFIAAVDFGAWRTLGMVTAYNAPLSVYKPLRLPGLTRPGDNVCLGKEWYRFPSSFHLPEGVRAKFVKSEFSGLLPGDFSQANQGFGLYPGAWLTPTGMNDENREDPSKYTQLSHCSFMVDSSFPSSEPSPLEPDYISQTDTWEKLTCEPFLDASKTGTIGRIGWVPDWDFIPSNVPFWMFSPGLIRWSLWGSEGLSSRPRTSRTKNTYNYHAAYYQFEFCLHPYRRRLANLTSDSAITMRDLQALLQDSISNIQNISNLQQAKPVIYLGLALVAFVYLIQRAVAGSKHESRLPSRSPDPEKPTITKLKVPERPPGVWIPSDFKRPTAAAYPDWSVETTKPLPYRPFRYGPKYNITMGLRTMNWDEWIELDNHYPRFHADKKRRIEERGSKCFHTDPSPQVFDGAVELLEELCGYLPERYPSMFRKTEHGMINLFANEIFDIRKDVLTMNGNREDPMQMAARMVQDDLAIMFEKEDGQMYLLAGAVLLAGFWRLQDKLGMSLDEIHYSGDVPGYHDKLRKGMNNFFRRIKPEAPVKRNNYFLQVDEDLAWSYSIGPEDAGEPSWDTAATNRAIEHHYFRSECQSLRRLPRSGGVLFTIRTYFHPITDIAQEDYVPGRLASSIRSWGDDVSKYKGKAKYGDVLLNYLDKKHEEQIANGLDLSREDECRAYPY